MRTARIAAASFLLEDQPHSIDMNIARAMSYIDRAAEKEADLLCLPETVITANVPDPHSRHAEPFPGKLTKAFCSRAKACGINLVVPYLVRVGSRVFNQATVIDRRGNTLGFYRKVHLTGAESQYTTPGRDFPVFQLDIGMIAIMICLDIYFPEIARIYALKGAEILLWPTMTHGPTQESLLAQLRSRAIDNSMVLVESNYACHPPYAPYTGRYHPGTARILDHNGDLIAQTGRRHGMAVAEIDLAETRLTSRCILLREPDHFREDLQSLTRLDLYAKEYLALVKKRGAKTDRKK